VANANRAPMVSVAEISQLNFLLGELFAEAVLRAARRSYSTQQLDLIGSHGQTVFHQPTPESSRAARGLDAAIRRAANHRRAHRNSRGRQLPPATWPAGRGARWCPSWTTCSIGIRRGRVALNLGGMPT
jgi:1,6-anhydro-N-acetylmuramate kinase